LLYMTGSDNNDDDVPLVDTVNGVDNQMPADNVNMDAKGAESDDDDVPLLPAKTPAPPQKAASTPSASAVLQPDSTSTTSVLKQNEGGDDEDGDDDDDDVLMPKKASSRVDFDDDDDELPLSSLTPKPRAPPPPQQKSQGKSFSRIEQMIEQQLMATNEEPIWNAGEGATQGLGEEDPDAEDSDMALASLPLAQRSKAKPKAPRPKKERAVKKEKVEQPQKKSWKRVAGNKVGDKKWRFRELESDVSSDEELSELNVHGDIDDMVRGAENAYKKAGEGSIDDKLQQKARDLLEVAMATHEDEIITAEELASRKAKLMAKREPREPREPKAPRIKEPRPPREPKVAVSRLRKRGDGEARGMRALTDKPAKEVKRTDIVEWKAPEKRSSKKDDSWWGDKKDKTKKASGGSDNWWEDNKDDTSNKRQRSWDDDAASNKKGDDDWNSNGWNSSTGPSVKKKFVINFSKVKKRMDDPAAYREAQEQRIRAQQQQQSSSASNAQQQSSRPVSVKEEKLIDEAMEAPDPFDVLFPDDAAPMNEPSAAANANAGPFIDSGSSTPKPPNAGSGSMNNDALVATAGTPAAMGETITNVVVRAPGSGAASQSSQGTQRYQGNQGRGLRSQSFGYDAFVRRRGDQQFHQRKTHNLAKLMASVRSY